MTMRQTPFQRIRYPWASDVVNATDVQTMGSDIDQALVQTASMASSFTRFASVIVSRTLTGQSLTKGALTAISFDTVALDNGRNSPLSNGAWFNAASPTRLTAPSPCVVLAMGFGGLNATGAWGSPAALQITIALNGAATVPGVQGTKYSPVSTTSGQISTSMMSMWKLAAGDFLELKFFWTGTPAGPFLTDTTFDPTLALAMVALPSVP